MLVVVHLKDGLQLFVVSNKPNTGLGEFKGEIFIFLEK